MPAIVHNVADGSFEEEVDTHHDVQHCCKGHDGRGGCCGETLGWKSILWNTVYSVLLGVSPPSLSLAPPPPPLHPSSNCLPHRQGNAPH
jgi:hypothetical protein